MKTIPLIVGMFSLGTVAALAGPIRLADDSVIDGEYGPPADVVVKTAAGETRIPFTQLPAEVQRRYWQPIAPAAEKTSAASATSMAIAVAPILPVAAFRPQVAIAIPSSSVPSAVVDDEFADLAGEVNLDTWAKAASVPSFRDKPEKRGPGGLVVAKAFNAIDENWSTVYAPESAVGQSGNWSVQVTRARALQAKAPQFLQKRWLELFTKAGDALSRRDSTEFASFVRELKKNPITVAMAIPKNS